MGCSTSRSKPYGGDLNVMWVQSPEIPTMIIQPFVENALIHGVLNLKDRAGKVSVKLDKKDDQVHCIISDNGVGRIMAQKIKESKSKRLRSIALYNIQERIAIIGIHANQEIIVDTVDGLENGQAVGTIVSFLLPLN